MEETSTPRVTPAVRIWPAIAIVLLQWAAVFLTGVLAPATVWQFFGMFLGPGVGFLLLFGWWLWYSDRPWSQRFLVMFLPLLGMAGALLLADPSVYQAAYIYGLPFLCLAFLLWLLVEHRSEPGRPMLMWAATVLVLAGGWTLVRTTGVDGDMAYDFEPRWTPTAEEEFLASEESLSTPEQTADEEPRESAEELGEAIGGEPATESEPAVEPEPAAEPEWPGLRGPGRDAVVEGVTLATDWSATPPEVIWRRPVGPGWSSFAVAGDVLYTQEQRGEEEAVSAYAASTGEPIWVHADEARFWEAMAGAGPRATPTLHEGRVYALGATGVLNALDAEDGSQIWQRDLAEDTGAEIPEWGFSASPLVVEDAPGGPLVAVHGGAPDGKALVAYDLATGETRWFADAGTLSYCSLHRATLEGVHQLLVATGDGVTSVGLDGERLWHHPWPVAGARIVQPAFTDDGEKDVLIGTGFGQGLRRIDVSRAGDAWTAEEVWTSRGMKPYYNDLVVHEGHAYGFDNRILAAIDLATGDRAWKGGRYGNGQLLLLADQDVLLVISDRGELALVAAEPDGFREIATFQAIEGKTWNHPALVGGVLYVRNGEEMAAVRLPAATGR